MSKGLQAALRGRFVSLESDVPDLEGGEGTVVVDQDQLDEDGMQVEGVETVEGDMLEMDDASDEVVDSVDAGEEMEEVSAGLEAFLDEARAGAQAGGWTKGEARAYQLGLECLLNRVGATAGAVMPSFESFDTQRTRLDQTVSVENRIKEALRSLWEGIKNMLSKMYAFFHKWYMKLLESTGRLQKRAKAIKAAAEKRSGSAKEKKIKVSVFRQLHVGKTMPSGGELVTKIKLLGSVMETATSERLGGEFGTSLGTIVDDFEKSSSENAADVTINSDAIGKMRKQILDIATKALGAAPNADATTADKYKSGEAVVAAASGEMPGGMVFVYSTHNAGATIDDLKANGNKTKLVVTDKDAKKVEVDATKEVATLSLSDIIAVCDATIDALQYPINYKSGYAKYERALKDNFKKLEKLANSNVDETDDAKKGYGKNIRAAISATSAKQRNTTNAINAVINYGVNVCRASVAYANSSLGQYSK